MARAEPGGPPSRFVVRRGAAGPTGGTGRADGFSTGPGRLRIVPPEGARVLSVELDGEARHASDVDLSMDLGLDREVVVRHRLPVRQAGLPEGA